MARTPTPPGTPRPPGQMGGRGLYVLPTTHQGAMRVPKGGASCSSCRYYLAYQGTPNGICRNQLFITWNGGDPRIPCPPNEHASDWWEARVSLPPCPVLR